MKKYITYILIICIVLSITGCVSSSNQVAEKAVKVLHSYLNAEITAQIAFGKLDVIHDELGENPKKMVRLSPLGFLPHSMNCCSLMLTAKKLKNICIV